MTEKRTIFDYLTEVLCIFAITILFLMIITRLFGESAQEISSMFRLGKEGLSLEIMVQFLATSVISALLRYIFFHEGVIPKLSGVVRAIFMLVSMIVMIIIFAALFDWFPINQWEPWAAFSICFVTFFSASTLIMAVKTSLENKRMEEALRKLQSKWKESEKDGKQD